MADKPIVLTRPNVCAVLERRKFQTRRIINPQPDEMKPLGEDGQMIPYRRGKEISDMLGVPLWEPIKCPYGVGDRAYVKEGYQVCTRYYGTRDVVGRYIADNMAFRLKLTKKEHKLLEARKFPRRKTPGRFMYKSLARIFLPIVEVRVEKLQDISEEDAKAEGVYPITTYRTETPYKDAFRWLWCSIHGRGAWERNDLVWVYRWDEIIIKGE